MSENTVRKYIRQLEEQELLFTEPTEIMTRAGNASEGSSGPGRHVTAWAAVCGGDSVGRVQAFRVGTVCRSSRY